VVGTLDTALRRMGQSMKKVERWKMEMPTEQEMLPKDKYTVFDRKVKRYRKGIHSKSHTVSAQESAFFYSGKSVRKSGIDMVADISQRCQSGQGSANDSILRVFRRTLRRATVARVYTMYYHTICIRYGAMERKQRILPKYALRIACSLSANRYLH
jgi:hypothetical protein